MNYINATASFLSSEPRRCGREAVDFVTLRSSRLVSIPWSLRFQCIRTRQNWTRQAAKPRIVCQVNMCIFAGYDVIPEAMHFCASADPRSIHQKYESQPLRIAQSHLTTASGCGSLDGREAVGKSSRGRITRIHQWCVPTTLRSFLHGWGDIKTTTTKSMSPSHLQVLSGPPPPVLY